MTPKAYPESSVPDRAQPELQVACGRDALVLRLLQLRRPPGHLLRFPAARERNALDKVQLGLLGSSFALVYGICAPFRGKHRRSHAPQNGRAVGTSDVEHHLHVHGRVPEFRHSFFFSARPKAWARHSTFRPRCRSSATITARRRARVPWALTRLSVYIGTIAGGFFGGLIGQYYGWRWSFIVFGGLGMLLGFVLMKYLVEPKRGAADLEDFGVREARSEAHAGRRVS